MALSTESKWEGIEVKGEELRNYKLFQEYANIRNMPKAYATTALNFYSTLSTGDKIKMITEFKNYILGVKKGVIIAKPVSLPKIPTLWKR